MNIVLTLSIFTPIKLKLNLMNRFTLFIISSLLGCLFCANPTNAQTKIGYEYDAAGNRISVRIISIGSKDTEDDDIKKKNFFEGKDINAPEDITAIEGSLKDSEILIYPNPTKGKMLFEVKGYNDIDATIAIYSIKGDLLKQKQIKSVRTPLDITNLNDGTYILRISDDDETIEYKVIKE